MSKILFASVIACILVLAACSVSFTEAFSSDLLKFAAKKNSKNKNAPNPPMPPTPSNNNNGTTQLAALSLLNQVEAAIEANDLNGFMSLLSDDFQGYFPTLYPRDVYITKSMTSTVIKYFLAVWTDIRIQRFLQTASNTTITGIWDVNGVVAPADVANSSSSSNPFYLDNIRHFILRTTADGSLVANLEFYQAPADGMQMNASRTAATARLFYSKFSDVDVPTMMAMFSPDAEYVEYGLSDKKSGVVCNFACIQSDFKEAFTSIFKNNLVVRSDADPIFVVFGKIATFRKQFFGMADPSNPGTCVYTGMNLASDVIEFDSTYKIRRWTAYYNQDH